MGLITPAPMPPERTRLTLEEFHALRDTRPKEEKWELIDGVPVMMPPPSLVHQRISNNLQAMLNSRLARAKPEWRADMEVGLLDPKDETYNPEPDVTVIDSDIELGQIYAERFYFVAEILSEDKPKVLAAKLRFYQSHVSCFGVIFVRQDCIEAELHVRSEGWSATLLTRRDQRIVIPVIGDIGKLEDAYRFTPLA